MNLSKFLKFVDEECKVKSKEELAYSIHEMARKLPEENREAFLADLKMTENDLPLVGDAYRSFRERKDAILADLKRIEDEEVVLDSELNENYDDWYHEDEDEFVFTDLQGIGRILETACAFLYECVDKEEYVWGKEVAERLLELTIYAEGEYQEYEGEDDLLSVADMSENGIASLDMKKLLLSALYLEYCASDLKDRPDAIHWIMTDYASYGVSLEQLMQYDEKLPEFDEFLKLWIAYLGPRTDTRSQILLEEALKLSDDEAVLLESARKYVAVHPGLYEMYMKDHMKKAAVSRETTEALYEIGQEALDAIDEKYVVRSRIALLERKLAVGLNKAKEGDDCLLEAFRSDSTPANYMRIRLTALDYQRYEGEVSRICSTIYLNVNLSYTDYRQGELKENKISSNAAYMLAFLEGNFEYVLNKGMKTKTALGWSGTFMKCGLAAFLLLLMESDNLKSGGRSMCAIVIEQGGDLRFALDGDGKKEGDAAGEFWKTFFAWKKTVSLSDTQKSDYLGRMEALIDLRVQGIMEANRRNYYDECAAYVAALGEVVESMGEPGGKQRVLEQYRAKYNRRTAFHQELRAYGMVKK